MSARAPLLLLALGLPLSPARAEPLLDLYLPVFAGAGDFAPDGFDPGLALEGGLAVDAWALPRLALGASWRYGTYGVTDEVAVGLLFAELRYGLDEQRSLALGLGSNIPVFAYVCTPSAPDLHPCGDHPLEWGNHEPILFLSSDWESGRGALHRPVGLRAEASPRHWALGVELGLGLRLRRQGSE